MQDVTSRLPNYRHIYKVHQSSFVNHLKDAQRSAFTHHHTQARSNLKPHFQRNEHAPTCRHPLNPAPRSGRGRAQGSHVGGFFLSAAYATGALNATGALGHVCVSHLTSEATSAEGFETRLKPKGWFHDGLPREFENTRDVQGPGWSCFTIARYLSSHHTPLASWSTSFQLSNSGGP